MGGYVQWERIIKCKNFVGNESESLSENGSFVGSKCYSTLRSLRALDLRHKEMSVCAYIYTHTIYIYTHI